MDPQIMKEIMFYLCESESKREREREKESVCVRCVCGDGSGDDGGGLHAFGEREKIKKAPTFVACAAAAACMHLVRQKK